MNINQKNSSVEADWRPVIDSETLKNKGQLKVRVDNRQIALFVTAAGIRACDNRCPHEGYPLSEGSVSDDCLLTCNWHNWKFDLDTGRSIYGGDQLRLFPVEDREGKIWIDLQDPPFDVQRAQIVDGLSAAFADHAYDRIAREIARLQRIGGDPLDALRLAIEWSWQRLEFGWTHAYAGMADWLSLYEEHKDDEELALVCLVESVGHIAYDTLRQPEFPYPAGTQTYDEQRFLAAIENEDEAAAVSQIRGALDAGMGFDTLEGALSRAALAHYNDFGHSLIYVTKAKRLIEKLGETVSRPLLLSLVRAIIFAAREDQIPEFRGYEPALRAWGNGQKSLATTYEWRQEGINTTLEYALSHSAASCASLYRHLLFRNAGNLLRFDLDHPEDPHAGVSENVGWLDFTHGITFANAVRAQCEAFPDLWPAGLLQMALFAGRNGRYTRESASLARWRSDDSASAMQALVEKVMNHGEGEYIVSVHRLKTVLAAREECSLADAGLEKELVAALNRYLGSWFRRRQPRRTAYQSLKFVSGGQP